MFTHSITHSTVPSQLCFIVNNKDTFHYLLANSADQSSVYCGFECYIYVANNGSVILY